MPLKIKVLTHSDNLTAALEFRASIMHQAFGVPLEQDPDLWDQEAYHIVATSDEKVVGYYRVMSKTDLGFNTETRFDLTNLRLKNSDVLEIGRAAVHHDYKNTPVIDMMWRRIINLANTSNCNCILGTPSLKPAEIDVTSARDYWRKTYQYLQGDHAVPLNPYTGDGPGTGPIPKLITVYEKLGVRIVSDPCWDPVFQTADVVAILNLKEMNSRWATKLQ
jgi:hypothetical protein